MMRRRARRGAALEKIHRHRFREMPCSLAVVADSLLAARGLDEARSSPDFWFLKFVPWLRFAPRMAFLPLRIPCSRLAAWMKRVLVEAC